MNLQTPLLAIVPIPNLQIDTVNVIFDMEVRESTQSESSKDMSASLSGSGSIFGFTVAISGSVSSHESNTRSTDNSAKYHVDVMATNHGTPEGLSRILDIIAANAAPDLVSSKDVDRNGQELSAEAQKRLTRLKQLQSQKDDANRGFAAAQNKYTTEKTIFVRHIQQTRDAVMASIQEAIVDPDNEGIAEALTNTLNTARSGWDDAINRADGTVKIALAAEEDPEKLAPVLLTKYDTLQKFDIGAPDKNYLEPYTDKDTSALEVSFNNAIQALLNSNVAQEKLDAISIQIDQLLSGMPPVASGDNTNIVSKPESAPLPASNEG
jgi:hypothetical protein